MAVVSSGFRKFLQLSPSERRMLFHAFWLLPLTSCALRVAGLERCQSILLALACPSRAPAKHPVRQLLADAQKSAAMVEIAARRAPGRARCLQKSLVLWLLVRIQGIPADLWLGVSKEGNGFEAHAWVAYAGTVLNDSADVYGKYAAFKSILSSAGMLNRRKIVRSAF
jgi:hypothetical protein